MGHHPEPQETSNVIVDGFLARAVKVIHGDFPGNFGPVAIWCDSEFQCSVPLMRPSNNVHNEHCYVRVEQPDGTIEEARHNDWVVKTDTGFRVYKGDRVSTIGL